MDADKELFGTTTLCNGGKLKAIVFCCSTQKPCPFRDGALKILGIDKDTYEQIKRSYKEYEDDRLCYGNLAFCCPLDKKCKKRDEVLHDKDLSPRDYIAFKTQLLKKFEEQVGDKSVFDNKVCYHYISIATELDGRRHLALMLLGNPEICNMLKVEQWAEVREGVLVDRQPNTEIVSLRLGQDLLEKLDALAKAWGKSRSEIIRTILAVAVTSIEQPVSTP